MKKNKNNYKVYKHTNLINGKIYIGETCEAFVTRCGHNGWGYHLQPKFYNDIIKYGWNNFNHEIIKDNLSHDDAIALEKKLIAKFNSMINGYNNSIGDKGCTGYHQTEEAKQKISEVQTGRERSIQDRENVGSFFREFYKTHPHPQTGTHQSQEAKEKFKQKMSGKNNPNYKKYGYANPTSKPVFQFDLNGNYIKDYGSIAEAERFNNYKTKSGIHACCKNKAKTAYDYIWRYQNIFTDEEKENLINNTKTLFDINK